MSKLWRKIGSSDILKESNLILVLITESMVADTAQERLISAINVKEAAPRRIKNGKDKAKMAHKMVTVIKV